MDLALGRLELRVGRRRAGEAHVLAEVERDPAAAAAERAGADPDDLAAGAELVEPGRAVGAEPARQHVALPDLRGQRDALERDQRLAQAVGAGAGRPVGVDVLPARQEAGQLARVDGLDLLAQVGEAGAAHPAQDVGVAPLALGAARAAARRGPARRRAPARAAPASGRPRSGAASCAGRERAVGAGVAAHQGHHRVRHLLEEGLRAARPAAARRARRGRGRRPRRRSSAPRRRSGPGRRGARARASRASRRPSSPRRPAPRTRPRSGRRAGAGSAGARRGPWRGAGSVRCWSESSTSSSASGSISSRSSSWPSSSRSRSRSSASAAARRSAFGVSPSYM